MERYIPACLYYGVAAPARSVEEADALGSEACMHTAPAVDAFIRYALKGNRALVLL